MARWWLAALLVLSACGVEHRVKKLSDTEFQHYYALKPFMEEEQRIHYLKLKTEEERDAYLKELGLWDRFYKYDDHIRKAIVDGAVQTGWTKDMVLMSWGAPYDKRKLTGRPASRSELLVYKFEKQEDGSVLVYVPNSKTEYKAVDRFMREVYLDNDVVTEIIEKKGWSN
jgi:hypothetical protein